MNKFRAKQTDLSIYRHRYKKKKIRFGLFLDIPQIIDSLLPFPKY